MRYSLLNPNAYVDSNLVGFVNVLEGCRQHAIQYLVYASSSSAYGGNTRMPFAERDNVDHPVSLYAATKKANELMAHTYKRADGAHLQPPLSSADHRSALLHCVRPVGGPDMALFLLTRAILEDRPIDVFNHGRMQRDFTYLGDIVKPCCG